MATCRVAADVALTADHPRREIEFISASSKCEDVFECVSWFAAKVRICNPSAHRKLTTLAVAAGLPPLMRAVIQGDIHRAAT